MLYVGNSFSLQMLTGEIGDVNNISIKVIDTDEAREIIDNSDCIISCVGHSDTAAVMSAVLGRDIDYNRINVSLKEGDTMLVGQLVGGRLPEGATTLPPNMKMVFMLVRNNGNMNEYCRQTLNGLNTSMDGFSLLFSAEAIEDKIKI